MSFEESLSKATIHLGSQDAVMQRLVSTYGPCKITPHTNYYEELCSSIISQQLSVKAAATIWRRFLDLYDGTTPTPEQILATDVEAIRKIGASYAKANYIQDLAHHILNGDLDLAHIATLDNTTVISQLTAVKGIGEWSAHMFMIFSLGRLDILPWGDLGVRKSAQVLYGLDALPNKVELSELSTEKKWHPFESVAAWYLWRNLDNT
jgi:DNA-3-methyladenine glycosylase II